MSDQANKRKYELRKRADSMEDTRRRITEAAVELHGSVGPAHTTVTALAERAGVQRHTVYRHFPTEDDLFSACSTHFWATHPFPSTEGWRTIADPSERLTTALDELYRYYERNEGMLANLNRDIGLPVVRAHVAPVDAYFQEAAAILSTGWPARGARRRVLAAAVGHALKFDTWRSLVREGGVTRAQAVRLAAGLVESASGA
jgi:AcrR family transcriptional regulator